MNRKAKMVLKENNAFEEKNLSEHSQKIMTDIVCYLRGSDLSEYNQEMIRKDINYMIADGESRGESIETIIGRDYQNFCDDIISTFPKKTLKEKVFDTISNCLGAVSIIMLIWFVGAFVRAIVDKGDVNQLYITLGEIIGSILLVAEATFIVNYILKTAFKEEKEQTKMQKRKMNIKLFFVFFIAIAIPVCLYSFVEVATFSMTLPVAISLIIVPFLIQVLLNNMERE